MIRVNVHIRPRINALMRIRSYSSNTNPVHRVARRALSTHVPTSMAHIVEPLNTSRDLRPLERPTRDKKKIDAIKPEKDNCQIDNELIQKIIERHQPEPKKDPLVRGAKIGAPRSGFVDDILLEVAASDGNLLAQRELERRQREE